MLSDFFRELREKKKMLEKIFGRAGLENQKISGMIKTKQKIHQVRHEMPQGERIMI